jgi:hypothetical protein
MNNTLSVAPRPRRRFGRKAVLVTLATATVAATAGIGSFASAGGSEPSRPIAINQTDGYGDGEVTVFTYDQNYQCIHDPFDDRDYDGKAAAEDPDEFQRPLCQVGSDGPSLIDPEGESAADTEPVYVIVPFFDADNDGEAAGGLAPTLQSLFGVVPDAFDPTPGVPVQCPEPGKDLTQHTGDFGTCSMHPNQIDLGSVLNDLGLIPDDTVLNVPLVNHSHVIDGKNFNSIWWRIEVVLVTDPKAWPDVAGTKGITSVRAMERAIARGRAIGPVDSNFFLHFDSRELHDH